MSYDLFFWREEPGAALDPDEVLETDDGVKLPGIVPMSRETVEAAFSERFPESEVGAAGIDWEGDGSYFQAGFTYLNTREVTLVGVCCGYELLKSPRTMDRLCDVAKALGCRLYDPQSD